jgi:cell division protein FtsZ
MINLDFADVKTVMANKGDALMGIGTASGEDRVIEATRKAIYSPLLETTIEGAENVLLNVTGGMDMSLTEAQDASELVIQAAGNDVNILLGTSIDDTLKDEIRVTVVATGVSEDDLQQAATRQTQAAPIAEQPRRRVLGSSNLDLGNNNFAPRPKTTAPESSAPESAFGNWDIRKENTVRQTPSEPVNTGGVSSFGGTTNSTNDDDLDIPPFLKR